MATGAGLQCASHSSLSVRFLPRTCRVKPSRMLLAWEVEGCKKKRHGRAYGSAGWPVPSFYTCLPLVDGQAHAHTSVFGPTHVRVWEAPHISQVGSPGLGRVALQLHQISHDLAVVHLHARASALGAGAAEQNRSPAPTHPLPSPTHTFTQTGPVSQMTSVPLKFGVSL